MFREVVENYFQAQNESQASSVAGLFTDDADVHNVNFPPFHGKNRILEFCEDLYSRTSAREFSVVSYVEGKDIAMAEWKGRLNFRTGAKIGPWTLEKPFEVELRGINKFEFSPNTSKIRTLRVYHETTTVAKLAQENQVKQESHA